MRAAAICQKHISQSLLSNLLQHLSSPWNGALALVQHTINAKNNVVVRECDDLGGGQSTTYSNAKAMSENAGSVAESFSPSTNLSASRCCRGVLLNVRHCAVGRAIAAIGAATQRRHRKTPSFVAKIRQLDASRAPNTRLFAISATSAASPSFSAVNYKGGRSGSGALWCIALLTLVVGSWSVVLPSTGRVAFGAPPTGGRSRASRCNSARNSFDTMNVAYETTARHLGHTEIILLLFRD